MPQMARMTARMPIHTPIHLSRSLLLSSSAPRASSSQTIAPPLTRPPESR